MTCFFVVRPVQPDVQHVWHVILFRTMLQSVHLANHNSGSLDDSLCSAPRLSNWVTSTNLNRCSISKGTKLSAAGIKPFAALTHRFVCRWKCQKVELGEYRHACHRYVLCFLNACYSYDGLLSSPISMCSFSIADVTPISVQDEVARFEGN